MKFHKLSGLFLILGVITAMTACEEETTSIGSSISSGEVSITVDTFFFNLKAQPVEIESFDSKTGNLLIGNIQTEGYGNLSCSFVTRLMCSPNLQIPDSLFSPARVDSCKLILGADRNGIIGDSLAPQRLAVYPLIKQLPSDISNNFDPEGYYDPAAPLASRSYTVSAVAEKDTNFYQNTFVELSVDLPLEFGKEIFRKYKEEPEIFAWPQTMAQKFLPGLFVKSTFGNGCIANITSAYVAVFYYNLATTTSVNGKDTVIKQTHVRNIAFPFTVSPEVLSSNNIKYTPSRIIREKNSEGQGEVVISTPGGYIAQYDFPIQPLIDRFYEKNTHLSTVNELLLYIPAEPFDEESGIGVAQNLLMVKASEYEEFFEKNKTPDNLSSFTGVYDSKNNRYYFTTLRNYFLQLVKKDKITKEDLEFIIVPVEITTESVNSYYGDPTTYVTKCVPYTSKPTLTLLKTDEAMVTFSFSTQMID